MGDGDFSPLDEEAEVAGFADLKGLLLSKHFSSIDQKQFHVPSTVDRLLSKRFITFSAFSEFTPT